MTNIVYDYLGTFQVYSLLKTNVFTTGTAFPGAFWGLQPGRPCHNQATLPDQPVQRRPPSQSELYTESIAQGYFRDSHTKTNHQQRALPASPFDKLVERNKT